jgi:hypothetical protein
MPFLTTILFVSPSDDRILQIFAPDRAQYLPIGDYIGPTSNSDNSMATIDELVTRSTY